MNTTTQSAMDTKKSTMICGMIMKSRTEMVDRLLASMAGITPTRSRKSWQGQ